MSWGWHLIRKASAIDTTLRPVSPVHQVLLSKSALSSKINDLFEGKGIALVKSTVYGCPRSVWTEPPRQKAGSVGISFGSPLVRG